MDVWMLPNQANSISIYTYIDIPFACFGSFAFRYLGSDPNCRPSHRYPTEKNIGSTLPYPGKRPEKEKNR